MEQSKGKFRRQNFGQNLLCAMAKRWKLLAWESMVGVSQVWVSSSVQASISIAKDEMRNPKKNNFLCDMWHKMHKVSLTCMTWSLRLSECMIKASRHTTIIVPTRCVKLCCIRGQRGDEELGQTESSTRQVKSTRGRTLLGTYPLV